MGNDVGTNLLILTANISPRMKYSLIFSCGQHLSMTYKTMNKQINNEVYRFFIDQVKQCYLEKEKFSAFNLIHTFEFIPNELECDLFTAVISFFDFNEINSDMNLEITQFMKARINHENNVLLMHLFGQRLLETKNHFKSRAFTGFFDLFPVETVLSWIEENPIKRASLLAYHLSYPTLTNPKCSELTLQLLEKYEDLPDVFKEFKNGTYNLKVVSISEIHANKDRYLSLYQTYIEYNNPISDWAKWRINYINETCKNMDEINIMDQRLSDNE